MKFIKRNFEILHTLVSLFAYLLGALLFGLALLPAYWLVSTAWRLTETAIPFTQALARCLALGAGWFAFGLSLLITIVIFRNLFRIKNRELSGEFRGLPLPLLRVALYNFLVNLAQQTFLPFVRGTPLINLFYRGMGAKVGRNTLITTVRLMDCDLIEIGDNCVIGGGVAISAHTGEMGQGVLKKVKIGDRVTIGADSIVLPGTIIEDHVMLAANSATRKDQLLESGALYGGVPAQKIR